MRYLNNNDFKKIPKEITGFKNLKYLDIHDNRISPSNPQFMRNHNLEMKIVF